MLTYMFVESKIIKIINPRKTEETDDDLKTYKE